MKRNFLQDVIPPLQKRSIRDIPLPGSNISRPIPEENTSSGDVEPVNIPVRHKPEVTIPQSAPPAPPAPPKREEYPDYSFDEPHGGGMKKWIMGGGILVVLIFAIFVSRTRAEVNILPKQEKTFIQDSYEIVDESLNNTEGKIGYKILSVEKSASTVVKPSGEENVTEKASGTITILNEYSEEDQKLVERTRFENKKGLVYRISESVTVPGYTEKNGNIIPGQIDVEVYADESGVKYNSPKSDLTIPGFSGLPQFDKMYAKGLTDMTGGFEGVKKVVRQEDKDSALNGLKEDARQQIITEINDLNDEFIIVFKEDDIKYSNISETDTKDGVELKITATVDNYVFDLKDLSRFIATQNIPGSPEGESIIKNPQELSINIVSTQGEDESEITEASIEGDIEIEWLVDEARLASELEGKDRDSFKDIISSFQEISRADAKVSPFWKSKFPKADKIEIIIQDYIDSN